MLTPTDDDVDEISETLTVAGSTTVTGFTVNGTTVTIADDDERGVDVGDTALNVSGRRWCDVHGGAGVGADRERDGDAVGERQRSEVTVSQSPLTFTPSDWDSGADGDGVCGVRTADAVNDTATVDAHGRRAATTAPTA